MPHIGRPDDQPRAFTTPFITQPLPAAHPAVPGRRALRPTLHGCRFAPVGPPGRRWRGLQSEFPVERNWTACRSGSSYPATSLAEWLRGCASTDRPQGRATSRPRAASCALCGSMYKKRRARELSLARRFCQEGRATLARPSTRPEAHWPLRSAHREWQRCQHPA